MVDESLRVECGGGGVAEVYFAADGVCGGEDSAGALSGGGISNPWGGV